VIEQILPGCTSVVEAYRDSDSGALFAQEQAIVRSAVPSRRREFVTARDCAHTALSRLGVVPEPILVGERGEPCWPVGVVGSITHCDGYRACAVARTRELEAIGIDAEPHAALPAGIESAIAVCEELRWLRRRAACTPGVHWDRLLFCAKESVYKAWFPRAKRRLGFEDVVITVAPDRDTFSAELLVELPEPVRQGMGAFVGRWLVRDGYVLTAVAQLALGRADAER
jgi:4'-phosphopantetheinyl transferase EntD